MRRTLAATSAIIRDTFREAFARKIFWGFYGLSTALILFFLFLLKIDVVQGAMATVSLFGHANPHGMEVAKLVRQVHAAIASFLYTAGMFLAVFASAGLIASIFEPGRIELLLSKPVSRAHLLMGRYLGNLLVVALNVIYLIGGVWLVIGWKTGIWNTRFLMAIATTVFMFAVLLSVITICSVLTESAAFGIMVTFALMIVSPILAQHQIAEKLLSSEWSRTLWLWLYNVLPKVFDVGKLNTDLVIGRPTGGMDPIWTSAGFATALLAWSIYSFAKRDY
jgi:ABC-type transport system involved in multi-copper enzyme maturation permease subunit